MDKIAVWGFRWAPSFAQGLVRDLRVRWALHEAGLPYETRLIGVEERTSAAHRERHPFGMVPVFEADGRQLIESGAIVYAVAKRSAALMPEDEAGRDQTLAWMFAALNTVDVPVQDLFDIDVLHSQETWAQLRRPHVVKAVEARLGELAGALGERDYLLGRFTAADILMVTVLRFIRHTDLVEALPTLAAYVSRCEARPAFRDALSEQMAEYALNTPAAA
jgi:glutathione S-transferase